MNKWIDSKSQISEGSMTAFGISICTRHFKANEMAEMLMFCHQVAMAGLETSVAEVFYDSNACICSFELNNVEPYSELDHQLLMIARNTLGQFEWNGTVEHGAPLGGADDEPF